MEYLLTKFGESWDTPAMLKERMNDLKRKMEELNAHKEDKESERSKELHPRKKLKAEVELWFKNVEKVNSEIQALEQKIRESNNFFLRGFFKGDVLKKIKEVEELRQGNFHDSLTVDNPRRIGQPLSTTTLFGGAAESCREEIWGYLMGADVQKIGVWGMGGIGKTTIMKLIYNELLKETENFDIVIWITVSREMNILKMQKRIARAMKEDLDEDEEEIIRAGMIHEMLDRKSKYVLILDDLWDELSLEQVGIPEFSNGRKLLVTTRLLNVCHYLDCQLVKVHTLSKLDGLRLFLKKVGQDVLSDADLLPLVESVAEECDGLPLAIVITASSMKGVVDVHEWRNALHELQGHVKSVNEGEEKVFQQLRFSYDRLGDEKVKHCFLCCALYPEDFEIDIHELIQLWIAEGLVEEMGSIQNEIDRGHAILNKLKNSCLIEDGISFRCHVKLHDVVRDMAIRITRPRFLVRSGLRLKEIMGAQDWKEDLEKASFMENRKLQIPPQMPPPKCPKLTTLLLSNCNIESIPECFFELMHGLKILDLSGNYHIKSLPNSISNLETLTTLLLFGCQQLEELPSFSKLQALKKLVLRQTKIKDVPHGMERLVNLKHLDLMETSIKEMADGILAKFTSLQYLRLNLFLKTGVRGDEIAGLRKLEFFHGKFSDLKNFKRYGEAVFAQEMGPREYFIYVGGNPKGISLSSRNIIEIDGCDITCTDDGIKVPSDVEELVIDNCTVKLCEEGAFLSRFIPTPPHIFSILSWIHLNGCKNIKKLFSSNWLLRYLPNLEHLTVGGCEDIEEIIALESELEEERISLPKLLWLILIDLPKLKSICGANGVMVCDSIALIHIDNCPKLKRIPLNLPLQDDGQPSLPPFLREIWVSSKKWWESLEWDHPDAKSLFVEMPASSKFPAHVIEHPTTPICYRPLEIGNGNCSRRNEAK